MTVYARTLTTLAVSALALSAAGAASAQTPYGGSSYGTPSGSFTSSCRDVQVLANGYISAQCRTDGGWRWSTIRADDCRNDITNRDGVLTCYGATARTGALYPDNQSGSTAQNTPGGVLGALLGAVLGEDFSQGTGLEDDWNRGQRPVAERSAALDARIDAGIREGSLDRTEAMRLRTDYQALVRLEDRYAADGRLTADERNDLRNRYESLWQRVAVQRGDSPTYGWQPLAEQRSAFIARVEAAQRSRRLNAYEAVRLRSDFDALVRIEDGYRRNGISNQEQQDLTARLAELNRRVGDGGGYDDGYGNDYGDRYDNDPRAAEVEARIRDGERTGRISRTEASRLRDELRDLSRRWSELEVRVDQARR